MVSELSARLMKGYNITYNSSTTRSERRSDISSSNSSTSGSSNDGDQDSHRSNSCIGRRGVSSSTSSRNSNSNNKKEAAERLMNRDACFKRRNIDDLRFAASMVKEDLEKGGLSFPSIHAKKQRTCEGYGIDMSSVRLLSAKSVVDTPFLTTVAGKRPFQSMSEIDQLFMETRQVYNKRWIQTDVCDWGDKSSVGSLTSDSETSCVMDIPPLLEDAIKIGASKPDIRKSDSIPLQTISMGAALEHSSEPRMVTLSFAPFLIIHVNPAFTRMTGNGAKDVLGKPFREVFKDKRCKAMAANVVSLACMNDQLTSVSTFRQGKSCNCTLKVSLVGDAKDRKSTATHCMVALHPTDQESPNLSSQLIATAAPKSSFPSMVMG